MAFYDNYKYEDYRATFDIADGDHMVTIAEAKEATSKTGRGMIEVTLTADKTPGTYKERIVENDFFNKNMSRFFDAFGILPGNFNFSQWKAKRAEAHFEHAQESFTAADGTQKTVNKARLRYFIVPEKQSIDFPEDIPYEQPATPAFKGGPATDKEHARITELLGAKYPSGEAVFKPEEKLQYQSYRKDMTAQELIVFIEKALKNRAPTAPEINNGQGGIF